MKKLKRRLEKKPSLVGSGKTFGQPSHPWEQWVMLFGLLWVGGGSVWHVEEEE